ncbi:MAG: TatD family hydrolase [Bdellovibrionales bacterium]
MLIDTHCHLDFPEFSAAPDGGLQGLLARAEAAGVGRMITISTHKSRFQTYIDLANQHPQLFCTVGVHPHHTEEPGEHVTSDELIALVNSNPKIVGIGETGLDYYYDYSDRDIQKKSFREHIRAAQDTQLPLVIHNRNSDDDMAQILTEAYNETPMPGLLHCFSSSAKLAEAALEIGFYLSFSGILTFKNAEEIRRVAKEAPADRIMVETDAPYLAPVPMRGKTNEPSYVVHTARMLAEVRGVSEREITDLTTENAKRLFRRLA